MNMIQDDIRDAIEKELVGANERFPLFASPHESIAVIAEEVDEAADALRLISDDLRKAWERVKRNLNALGRITEMKVEAENLAIEACQVAAMCEKAIQSAANWNDSDGTEGSEEC